MVGEQYVPAQNSLDMIWKKGVEVSLTVGSTIGREQKCRRQMQELQGALDGERGRIWAYGLAQYTYSSWARRKTGVICWRPRPS